MTISESFWNIEESFGTILVREGLFKKKSVKFHTWRGGGPDQFRSFSHFFFSTLNHANMVRNNVHGGGEGCSLYK